MWTASDTPFKISLISKQRQGLNKKQKKKGEDREEMRHKEGGEGGVGGEGGTVFSTLRCGRFHSQTMLVFNQRPKKEHVHGIWPPICERVTQNQNKT